MSFCCRDSGLQPTGIFLGGSKIIVTFVPNSQTCFWKCHVGQLRGCPPWLRPHRDSWISCNPIAFQCETSERWVHALIPIKYPTLLGAFSFRRKVEGSRGFAAFHVFFKETWVRNILPGTGINLVVRLPKEKNVPSCFKNRFIKKHAAVVFCFPSCIDASDCVRFTSREQFYSANDWYAWSKFIPSYAQVDQPRR